MAYTPYNMTTFEACRNIADCFVAVNDISGGWLSGLGLLSFYAILFVVLLAKNPVPESFVSAGMATTIISMLLLAIGASSYVWVVGLSVVTALGAVGTYLRNKTT